MSQLTFGNAELTGACIPEHFCLPVQLPTGGKPKSSHHVKYTLAIANTVEYSG